MKSQQVVCMAWERGGVWVSHSIKDNRHSRESFEISESADQLGEHLRYVKECGGVCFANPMDSPDVAAFMANRDRRAKKINI